MKLKPTEIYQIGKNVKHFQKIIGLNQESFVKNYNRWVDLYGGYNHAQYTKDHYSKVGLCENSKEYINRITHSFRSFMVSNYKVKQENFQYSILTQIKLLNHLIEDMPRSEETGKVSSLGDLIKHYKIK